MSVKNQIYNLRTLLWSPTPPWMRSIADPIKRQTKKELKLINLKSVKRLHFQFDPFHENVDSIRYSIY